MSNLKNLTKEEHTNAERQDFVKVLMSGKINPKFYATYLWNQHIKYDLLEACISVTGKLIHIPGIWRKQAIFDDYLELWGINDEQPHTCKSTLEYVNHIKTIMMDEDKLMAHFYVHHMGDLSGGQMIAKKVPGKGKFYKFDGDIQSLKEEIRSLTNDDMADESKIAFNFATRLFKELMELDIEHYQTDEDTAAI